MSGDDRSGLDVVDLRIAYGGHVAVDSVTFSAPRAAITGLIGPNGAGKTSTFNGCNGLVKASRGTVSLFGRDVTSKGPAARARAGLGRTFQMIELCNGFDVRANVALGAEARYAGTNPLRQLHSGPARRREVGARTESALDRCRISHLAGRRVATLNVGQRRLVELARVLASDCQLLLLDEPSSGLDTGETERFGQILAGLVQTLGLGILLVEHDMGLVMSICDQVFVLEFGHVNLRRHTG